MQELTMTVDADIKIKNRNELDELLVAIQKNVTELKVNLDKLETFKIDITFEQIQNDTSDN
ncbi:hypothetical protein JJQ58_01040 [Mammaliicoccus fleurettii]|uniref:Uncharacterized protein n=1 Tax=Mammaliicoccus fleurettii TaxID=150056 RepID=A0ABS5MJN0_9STAP|nr:hypothetical protein [Mammaliicoccus fleurettii]MBL0846564.1 hypothetical protein [Mammaliicoccus fleurettii]MBS3671005.1 hypothetical protein [Mammaliicoccus fleurettii]MBS3696064.1 hypothetical protein [Mammaliicoccus fleurettii]